MAVKSYNPKNVSLIVGGQTITGYADSTFIKVERNKEAFALKVGASGEGARAQSNDKSGKITVTLLQTSSSNDTLSGFAAADELSGTGAVPVLLRDNSGRTLVTALTAWVTKYSDGEFAQEISNRSWVLETDELDVFIGGN